MILGIAGSRQRRSSQDKELIRERILTLKPELIITTGAAIGPDLFAKEIAKELNIPLKEFDALQCKFPRWPEKFPEMNREKEVYARNLRRGFVGIHADYLLFMTSPLGKHGEIISAYYFMMHHKEGQRWKHLEVL